MRALILSIQVLAPWILTIALSSLVHSMLSALEGPLGNAIRLVSAGIFFLFGFPIISGILSIPFRSGVKSGLLPRTISNNKYFFRRLHAANWVAVYYFAPIYQMVLALPALFAAVFRLFGYKGSFKITVFPDTWLRDLPLLKISDGVYMANKSTIGTNLCLTNGKILVDGIELGEGAMVGHLAALGPGVRLGKKSQVGVNCGIGVRTKLAENVDIGLYGFVHHGVSIGANTVVGANSFIGLRAKIGNDLVLPPGTNIPGGSMILTKEDLQKHLREEKVALASLRVAAVNELATGIKGSPSTLEHESM